MTHLTHRLIAAGIGIALLAMPLTVGAQGDETHKALDTQTIRFLETNLWDYDPIAVFAQDSEVGLTTIEEIANGEILDSETIRFLEMNLWDYEEIADFQGLNPAIDPFLGEGLPKSAEYSGQAQAEEQPWLGTASEIYGQDDRTDIAEYGGTNPEVDPFMGEGLPKSDEHDGFLPLEEAPGLNAGELNY